MKETILFNNHLLCSVKLRVELFCMIKLMLSMLIDAVQTYCPAEDVSCGLKVRLFAVLETIKASEG